MNKAIPIDWTRHRVVNSLYGNLERLVEMHAPRSARLLLGARWSFAVPHRAADLYEYSLPLNPIDFRNTLAIRTGIVIDYHSDDDSEYLYDCLKQRQALIAAVDSFFLPYRPAFQRVHSNRTIIINGTGDPFSVWVEDSWPPSYRGPLSVSDLEKARHSSVPRVPSLEPIFSGHAINGEWFSVKVRPTHIADPRDWAVDILSILLAEAQIERVTADASFGDGALEQLAGTFAHDRSSIGEGRELHCYKAALVLRTEVSARVYLCTLLQACAGWIHSATLREAVVRYSASLSHLEMARDVLIKAMAFKDCPIYRACIVDALTSFLSEEKQILAILEQELQKCGEGHSRTQSHNLVVQQGDLYA